MSEPTRCVEECWTPAPCPRDGCSRTMTPRGRSVPDALACVHSECPADTASVNPRHLWSANDEERWRFYPEEAPGE